MGLKSRVALGSSEPPKPQEGLPFPPRAEGTIKGSMMPRWLGYNFFSCKLQGNRAMLFKFYILLRATSHWAWRGVRQAEALSHALKFLQ